MQIFGNRSNGSVRNIQVTDEGLFYSPNSLWTISHDYVGVSYPSSTVEVYTTRQGGAAGAIQEVVTITYTDETKNNISSAERA